MAKLLFTAIVADMRNKLNGTVFSKNRYGAYARTKVTPVNPQSPRQQAVRNRLSTNSQAWRGLTEAQRQSWITGAQNFPTTDIFGNPKTLSGNALYVQLNNNLQLAGLPAIATAPLPVAMPVLTLPTLTAVSATGVITLAFTPTPTPTNFRLVVSATPNVGAGISFVKNLYRVIFVAGAAFTTPATLTTQFAAVHGAPVLGSKIFIKAYFVSTLSGQAGIPVSILAIVS